MSAAQCFCSDWGVSCKGKWVSCKGKWVTAVRLKPPGLEQARSGEKRPCALFVGHGSSSCCVPLEDSPVWQHPGAASAG